jgi:hypothetical protein
MFTQLNLEHNVQTYCERNSLQNEDLESTLGWPTKFGENNLTNTLDFYICSLTTLFQKLKSM